MNAKLAGQGVQAAAATRDLLDEDNRVPASAFPRAGDPTDLPGLYAWFVDASGAAQLAAGLGLKVSPGLIYAGQAGAGSSTATLKSRIRGNHLGGTITGSTFRMTLASILGDSLGLVDTGGRRLAFEGETRLSAWMLEHLALAIVPEANRALVTSFEGAVLARLDPPLNLQGMAASPIRAALSARRRRPLGGQRGSPPATPRERVALVGCVKSKHEGTHPARDLYTSPLFRKRRAFVEAAGLRWWILSAKHGLVRPDEPVSNYNQTLNEMSRSDRRAWGERVLAQLRAELGDLGRYTFEIHAGSRYVDAIAAGLEDAGATFDVPTAGLGLGRQLAFYGREEQQQPHPAALRG